MKRKGFSYHRPAVPKRRYRLELKFRHVKSETELPRGEWSLYIPRSMRVEKADRLAEGLCIAILKGRPRRFNQIFLHQGNETLGQFESQPFAVWDGPAQVI